MTTTPFTLIDDGASHEFDATINGSSVRIASDAILQTLGFTLTPEGLCQGDLCIPIAARKDLIDEQGIDLAGLADALGRPVAIDAAEAAASMGAATASHGEQLASGIAPDFTLPDLSGKEHSLSSFRGKKVLLIAYASW